MWLSTWAASILGSGRLDSAGNTYYFSAASLADMVSACDRQRGKLSGLVISSFAQWNESWADNIGLHIDVW